MIRARLCEGKILPLEMVTPFFPTVTGDMTFNFRAHSTKSHFGAFACTKIGTPNLRSYIGIEDLVYQIIEILVQAKAPK